MGEKEEGTMILFSWETSHSRVGGGQWGVAEASARIESRGGVWRGWSRRTTLLRAMPIGEGSEGRLELARELHAQERLRRAEEHAAIEGKASQ